MVIARRSRAGLALRAQLLFVFLRELNHAHRIFGADLAVTVNQRLTLRSGLDELFLELRRLGDFLRGPLKQGEFLG